MYTRVHWLLDGVAARTHPNDWGELLDLSSTLFGIMGNKNLKHEIIDPLESFRKLGRKLIGNSVSAIIDISGWIGYGLKPLFPNAELVTDFSISRVTDISSEESTTAGFVMNYSPDEVRRRARELDLSSILLVDDATVSGRTNRVVMDTWGIEPLRVTHASLLVNMGDYPKVGGRQIKRGAAIYLEGLGSQIVYGDTMVSPQDEAEHLLDIFQHPYLEKVFSAALEARHYRTSGEWTHTEQLREFFPADESGYLFPYQIMESDIIKLANERRFVTNPEHKTTERSLFCKSPLLWIYNNFWGYIDEVSLQFRQSEVLGILNRFRGLINDPKNIFEARQALVRETQKMINKEKE